MFMYVGAFVEEDKMVSRPLARGVSGCLLGTLLLILDTLISIFLCILQRDEKELDTQFTPNVYFWTPNSEILAKTLMVRGLLATVSLPWN